MILDSSVYPPFQFKLRSLLAFTAIVAVVLAWVVAIRDLSVFHDPNDRRGPVEDRSAWPRPLQELLAEAAKAKIDVSQVSVYNATNDMFNDYYYWQTSASPELVDLMVNRWHLKPATKDEIERFWHRMPKDWGTANATLTRRYLAWYGHKSDNFVVMIDDSNNVVHVFYYYNF